MISNLKKISCALAITLSLSLSSDSLARSNDEANIVIPEMGPAGIRGMTVQEEKLYGNYFLRKAYGAGAVSFDPVLNEYINTVGRKLIINAHNVYFPFEFILSSDKSLNASAFLGGKVQINAGLIHYTENEDEFASVIAHEISHVTQRHIARFIEDQSDRSTVNVASLIGSIVLAIINPTVGMAALSTTSGMMAQTGINFTRDNESEADRIGINVLHDAGYNPMAMSDLFRKLLSLQGTINPAYAMLIDHPLSEIRVSEAYNRAKNFPKKENSKNPNFMLAKARIDVRYMDLKLPELKERLLKADKVNSYYKNYALALIYFEEKDFDKAKSYLSNLNSLGENDFVLDLQTDIDISSKNYQNAISRLNAVYKSKPYDTAIAFNLANAYIEAKQGNNAIRVLKRFLQRYPDNYFANDLIVKAYLLNKDKCSALQGYAKTASLAAKYNQANRYLNNALHLCSGTERDRVRALFSKYAEMKEFDKKFDKKR